MLNSMTCEKCGDLVDALDERRGLRVCYGCAEFIDEVDQEVADEEARPNEEE